MFVQGGFPALLLSILSTKKFSDETQAEPEPCGCQSSTLMVEGEAQREAHGVCVCGWVLPEMGIKGIKAVRVVQDPTHTSLFYSQDAFLEQKVGFAE